MLGWMAADSEYFTGERMMATKTCEICGDVVKKTAPATKCGHTVHLCETCKKTCPGALRVCTRCEEMGL
jgi:hypothetical protein